MKKFIPLFRRIIWIEVLVLLILILAVLKTMPTVCEWMARGPDRIYSLIMSKISGVISISLTELTYVILAAVIVYLVVLIIISLTKKKFMNALHRFLEGTAIILTVVAVYNFSCECSYNRKALPLPYYQNDVERTEHIDIYNYFADDVNLCVSSLAFAESGEVKTDLSFNEIVKEVKKAYSILEGNDYYSSHFGSVKRMASSFIYREFQITGVTYSTLGEANINILNTMSDIPLTIAHELAHTKGVMREDDANMLAFYVCLNSEHPLLRYSAYASYFYQIEAMASNYYLTDEERTNLHPINSAFYKTRNYVYQFWKKHDLLGDIGEFINDLYIKMSGVEEGTSSYSGGSEYEHDPTTSKLIPSLYHRIFFEKYYR